MKIGIVQGLNDNFEVVDEDDEDAPLMTILFHNDGKKIPVATRWDLIHQMVHYEKPKLWLIGLIWGLPGIAIGWSAHALVGFLRAM